MKNNIKMAFGTEILYMPKLELSVQLLNKIRKAHWVELNFPFQVLVKYIQQKQNLTTHLFFKSLSSIIKNRLWWSYFCVTHCLWKIMSKKKNSMKGNKTVLGKKNRKIIK